MEVDLEVSIIFGKAFLRTVRANIDMEKEKLTLRYNNQDLSFFVKHALKYSDNLLSSSFFTDDIYETFYEDKVVQKKWLNFENEMSINLEFSLESFDFNLEFIEYLLDHEEELFTETVQDVIQQMEEVENQSRINKEVGQSIEDISQLQAQLRTNEFCNSFLVEQAAPFLLILYLNSTVNFFLHI